MYKNPRVLFQSKVDGGLLQKFREVQLQDGRTTRFMIEKFMEKEIETHNDRRNKNVRSWSRKII